MGAPLDIRPVLDTEALRVWFHRGRSKRLVLCFSGVGVTRDKWPDVEFARTASGDGRDHVAYFADPARSWLNAPGLIEEITSWAQAFRTETGAEEIVTLGHSMGGFTALAMPAYMGINVALATGPQYSVHPDVTPDERRWGVYRKRISDFRIRELGGLFNDETAYYVLHGDHWREAPQRERFPERHNMHHLFLKDVHHDVPQLLQEKGVLQEVIEAAFQDRAKLVRKTMERAGIPVYRRRDAANKGEPRHA
jgi:pimeloyl-ACP methyl ester carboxylesterase